MFIELKTKTYLWHFDIKKLSENFQQVQHYIFLRNYMQIDFKKVNKWTTLKKLEIFLFARDNILGGR